MGTDSVPMYSPISLVDGWCYCFFFVISLNERGIVTSDFLLYLAFSSSKKFTSQESFQVTGHSGMWHCISSSNGIVTTLSCCMNWKRINNLFLMMADSSMTNWLSNRSFSHFKSILWTWTHEEFQIRSDPKVEVVSRFSSASHNNIYLIKIGQGRKGPNLSKELKSCCEEEPCLYMRIRRKHW